jgi:lipopolysaccharide transport system permease protein
MNGVREMSQKSQARVIEARARKTVIHARKGWGWIDWRELWQARDLVLLLVRRHLVTKYAQTVLGPLWFIIQPIGLAIVVSVALNRGAGVATAGVPPFLFNLCSLAPWFYFSQTFAGVGATFVNNADLFQKVYFPRSAIPLAQAISNLVALSIHTIVFLIVLAAYCFTGAWPAPSINILLLPLLFVELIVFTLGISLCVASLAVRYRDLIHAIQYMLLMAMFASLVFVPVEELGSNLRWLPVVNPLAVIIETTRSIVLGIDGVSAIQLVGSVVISGCLFLIGLMAFERAARTAVDVA